MAHNYMNLFKDKTFRSFITEGNSSYGIVDKTCMFIRLPINGTEKESEDGMGDVCIAKMDEIIHKMSTNPTDAISKGRIGLIYFKTENNEVFPKLFLYLEFCDFIRDNFLNPILHLEGQIRLEGGTSAPAASRSKRFHKSCTFRKHIRSLALTSPFPFAMVQPIKDCKWFLESFSLSIGWEQEEGWRGGNLKSSSNQLLQNLFGNDSPPKDYKFVAANGAEIPFHGQILAAKSPALAAMVNPNGAMKEHESKLIEMKSFSEESLNAFVRYIYCQPVSLKEMDCDTVLELFRLGHMYQLPELSKNLSKMMLQQGVEWFSPNCALELYFLVKNHSEFTDLADHSIVILLKLGDAVRESKRYQELDMKEVTDLLWMLLKKSTSG